ncbi:MAG TPA: hydantoinase B/oxoprolinase family protein [Amycolatopsis sp.]|nr:hydantoinase B/oxoprolinase family protein [Amycolatopsis sp.]
MTDTVTDFAPDLEIFRFALEQVAGEMVVNIIRTARSVAAIDSLDFSTAVLDSSGRLVAQGPCSPFHLAALSTAWRGMRSVVNGFAPGDIYLFNDPYLGGMHLPDLIMFAPVFACGDLQAVAAVLMHQTDIGGRVPGGVAADSRTIFEEGLRLPPVRLARKGVLDQDILAIIGANVRVPDHVVGDIQAMAAGCRAATVLLRELVEERGAAWFGDRCEQLIAYSRAITVAAVRALPPGPFSFEDALDDDGVSDRPVRIAATVSFDTERGRMRVDLRESSEQRPCALNATEAVVRSCCVLALASSMGREVPLTEGVLDQIDLVTRPGSVLSPLFPAAVGGRGITAFRLIDVLFGAMAQARPEAVRAAGDGGAAILTIGGVHEGAPFVYFDVMSGSWGGGPRGDGVDGISTPGVNMQNTPIEVVEAEYPIRIARYEFLPGTGGRGRYRGGLALAREIVYEGSSTAVLQVRSDRTRTRPYGLHGGTPGAPGRVLFRRNGTDTWETLPSKITRDIEPGDTVRVETAGGGGWGNESDRDLQDRCEPAR